MLSRRGIVVSNDDVKYYYYVTPWQLESWIRRINLQNAVLRPPTGKVEGQAVASFIQELKKEGFEGVTDWYVILSPRNVPKQPGSLQPVTGGNWGEHYRLYRLLGVPQT